jgi:arylsulfatase A-like enzyme
MFDLCSVPQPEGIEAISMRPLLEDPGAPWKKGALMWAGRSRSIVTGKWRYCEYKNDRRELFDRDSDPGEFTNLAEDPEHAGTVAELSDLIKGGWQACLSDE